MFAGSKRRRSAGLAVAVAVTASVVASLTATDLGVVQAQALTTHTVTSPDGEITFAVHEQPSGALTYEVTAGTTTIFEESPLGIATSAVDFSTGLTYASQSRTTIDQTYTLPAGTKPSYRDHANQLRHRRPQGREPRGLGRPRRTGRRRRRQQRPVAGPRRLGPRHHPPAPRPLTSSPSPHVDLGAIGQLRGVLSV